MSSRLASLALLAALAEPSAPAHAATVGPIEALPAAQALGREAFPVDPIGRTWTYRRGDGTKVERTIRATCATSLWNMIVVSEDPFEVRCVESASSDPAGTPFRKTSEFWIRDHGWQLDRTDWSYDTGPVRPAIERIEGEWLRFPLTGGARWSSGFVDLDRHGRDPWRKGLVLRHAVLGRATVSVAAGTFHDAVVVETRSEADDDRWARRTFYVGNVGPVLELEEAADGSWPTDSELESFRAGPSYVSPDGDFQLVAAPAGSVSPSWAWTSTPSQVDSGVDGEARVLSNESLRDAVTYLVPHDGTRRRLPLQQDLAPPLTDRTRPLAQVDVVTPAGRFEKTVVLEASEPARDGAPERPIRRTYYAANVGPVLVLVPEGADKWVADLVLESYSVGPSEPAQRRAATGAAPTNHAAPAAEPVRQRAATGAAPTKVPNAGANAK